MCHHHSAVKASKAKCSKNINKKWLSRKSMINWKLPPSCVQVMLFPYDLAIVMRTLSSLRGNIINLATGWMIVKVQLILIQEVTYFENSLACRTKFSYLWVPTKPVLTLYQFWNHHLLTSLLCLQSSCRHFLLSGFVS